jgi:hypothetical protein
MACGALLYERLKLSHLLAVDLAPTLLSTGCAVSYLL